jgi:hypothetical protein
MSYLHYKIDFVLSKYYVDFKDLSMKFRVFNSKSLSNKSILINFRKKIIIDLRLWFHRYFQERNYRKNWATHTTLVLQVHLVILSYRQQQKL